MKASLPFKYITAVKNGKHYVIFDYKEHNKRKRKWVGTDLPEKCAKKMLTAKVDEIVTKFSEDFMTGKVVHLIGYIDEKYVPFYCLQQLSADYFCQKQLTWCGEPNVVQVTDFMQRDFDILLDFNYRYHAPIETILATAHSKFVIGSCADYKDIYDLYIQTESGNYNQFLNSTFNYTQKLSGK